MTQTYSWLDTRDRAIELFHDTPNAQQEQTILEHFAEQPVRVVTLVDAIGRKVADGKVRAGWEILRRELTSKPAELVADDLAEQARAIVNAEAWIRHAGGYLDRDEEFVDALFGVATMTPDVGFLERLDADTVNAPGRYMYAGLLEATIARTREHGPQEVPGSRSDGLLSRFDSPELRARMVAYWRVQRSRFEACEREAVERQAAQADALRALRKQPARAVVPEDDLAYYDTLELPEEATA